MPSLIDMRRRIRSVKNTQQITKAMKMVSAAKLRRAQEQALAARPYARMITSVLESLARRIEIYDPETGNLRHPLFATREEKRVLLIVVSGDKGFAGAFNANIIKAALGIVQDIFWKLRLIRRAAGSVPSNFNITAGNKHAR